MEKQEFLVILDRYIAGEATPEEQQMVVNYLDSFQGASGAIPDTGDVRERVLLQLQEQINQETGRVFRLKPWLRVAAVVLVLCLAGGGYLLFNKKPAPPAIVASPGAISPGYNRAVLTLADGSRVTFDSAGNRQIVQGNMTVQQQGGHIQYSGTGEGQLAFNTLSTPRGGQFSITLPDGSRVWLNAASSIRYPLAFDAAERLVEINGEAYFEVAPDAGKPFRVKTRSGTEINVLGTSFNINAYDNEATIRTTLLDGAVRVTKGASSRLLKPGEQAAVSSSGIELKTGTDVDKVVAWKNGYFNFNGMKLREVMRQLERWYDIEIIYEQGVPDIEFYGELTRNNTLQEMVKALGASGLKVRIEGKKMSVIK